jgi:hypothetical protein
MLVDTYLQYLAVKGFAETSVGATVAIGAGSGNAGAGVTGNVAIGWLWGNPNGLGSKGFEPVVLSTLGMFAHGHNKPGV